MHIPRKFATTTPHGWVSGPRVGPVETHGCTGTRFTPLVMSVVVTMSLDPHWGNMSRTTFVPMNVPCSVCALDVDAAVGTRLRRNPAFITTHYGKKNSARMKID